MYLHCVKRHGMRLGAEFFTGNDEQPSSVFVGDLTPDELLDYSAFREAVRFKTNGQEDYLFAAAEPGQLNAGKAWLENIAQAILRGCSEA